MAAVLFAAPAEALTCSGSKRVFIYSSATATRVHDWYYPYAYKTLYGSGYKENNTSRLTVSAYGVSTTGDINYAGMYCRDPQIQ